MLHLHAFIAIALVSFVLIALFLPDDFPHIVQRRALDIRLATQQDGKKARNFTDKWIIVTSVQYPTGDVYRLANTPGWTLLVVGDAKTPEDWHEDGAVFLSLAEQRRLGFASVNGLPTGSYTRKNAGYLFAIANGAEWIYDTDDDNKPHAKGLDQFDYGETISGYRFTGSADDNSTGIKDVLFNPYLYFGSAKMWPRGFPLEHIQDHAHRDGSYRLCMTMRAPAVQQGIVVKDPDVDAIYRLLHAEGEKGLDERFNQFAPAITLAPGTFAPWNSQNTLFSRSAFFGLFLPTTVAFRVTDIWRSYFTQALLHAAGETVSFVPANAKQVRNAHNYLKDFDQEVDVYDKTGDMVAFLNEWRCIEKTIDQCMILLSQAFADRGYWGSTDHDLIVHWVEDLRSIGYVFPEVHAAAYNEYPIDGDHMKMKNCRRAHFNVKIDLPAAPSEPALQRAQARIEDFDDIKNWCGEGQSFTSAFWDFSTAANLSATIARDAPHQQKNYQMVAILTNNYQWSLAMGLLQRLYESQYAMLIFCGTMPGETMDPREASFIPLRGPINYIHMSNDEVHWGYRMYYCLAKVAEMRLQNVKGYYMWSDDMVFNSWIPLDPDLVHTGFRGTGANNWWSSGVGQIAAMRGVGLIRDRYNTSEPIRNMVEQMRLSLERIKYTHKNKTIRDPFAHIVEPDGWLIGDWVYYPTSNITFVQTFAEIMAEADLFHEIFVSKLDFYLPSVQHEHNPRIPSIKFLWGGDRGRWAEIYNDTLIGMHPLKLSAMSQLHVRRQYCDSVLDRFHARMFFRRLEMPLPDVQPPV